MLGTLRDLSEKLHPKQHEDSDQNLRRENDVTRASASRHIEPTISTTSSPAIGIELESLETIPDMAGSTSSLASSSVSSHRRTSETGVETEEDDGMILVGRPT